MKFTKEPLCGLMVKRNGGAGIVVKTHSKRLKRVLVGRMIAIDDVFRIDRFLLRRNSEGHAVFIRSADEQNVSAFQSLVARIDIGRQIRARKVSQVDVPVGVWQCRSDQDLRTL